MDGSCVCLSTNFLFPTRGPRDAPRPSRMTLREAGCGREPIGSRSQPGECCNTIEAVVQRVASRGPRGAATTSCNHLARPMPATQRPPGALETLCLVPHACCRRRRRRSQKEERLNGPVCPRRPCNVAPVVPTPRVGGQRYRSGTRANQRSKIDTYICRNVESIDSSLAGCSEHLQGDSGWNARRVPLSTEIPRERTNGPRDAGDSLAYWYHSGG